MKQRAEQRSLTDLSVGPVLTLDNPTLTQHIEKVKALEGAKVLFGGNILEASKQFPPQYGGIEPTAIFVPLKTIEKHFDIVQTEIFGPF